MDQEINEPREKIWDEYTGTKTPKIRHNFVDYNRYHEASAIADTLENKGVDLKGLKVIDFGCCAGDYGMYFARRGAEVIFNDTDPNCVDFVRYRVANEKQNISNIAATLEAKGEDSWEELKDLLEFDLAIFGEVLEHCPDSFEILDKFVVNKTKYIFTSSYPYRTDDPEDPYWKAHDHSNRAREMQKICRELLEKFYNKTNFGGEKNLWIRKEET